MSGRGAGRGEHCGRYPCLCKEEREGLRAEAEKHFECWKDASFQVIDLVLEKERLEKALEEERKLRGPQLSELVEEKKLRRKLQRQLDAIRRGCDDGASTSGRQP